MVKFTFNYDHKTIDFLNPGCNTRVTRHLNSSLMVKNTLLYGNYIIFVVNGQISLKSRLNICFCKENNKQNMINYFQMTLIYLLMSYYTRNSGNIYLHLRLQEESRLKSRQNPSYLNNMVWIALVYSN